MTVLDPLLAYALAVLLVWSSSLNLLAPDFVAKEFAKWGYPAWFRVLVGLTELTAAGCLAIPRFRVVGAVLALLILLGVIGSFARTREWFRMDFPLFLAVVCIGIIWSRTIAPVV